MKCTSGLWVLQTGVLLSLWLGGSPTVCALGQGPSGDYDIVESTRPDGKGGYQGKVSIHQQGPSYAVDWKLKSGESYTGVGILSGQVLGVGYGDGLSGLAVYQIDGGTLTAKWLLPATPQQVGEYQLVGPASLNGVFKFSNGMSGSVVIKPNGDTCNIVWNLPSGSYSGVSIRVGDRLVAVSGTSGQLFGVAAYIVSSQGLTGVWTVSGQSGVGTEILGGNMQEQPQEVARPGGEAVTSVGAAGAGVLFDGETYRLANTVSAPGKPITELREFVRSGETLDNYAKLVAFRLHESGASPAEFTQALLKQVSSNYPQAKTNEIDSGKDSSTVEFLIIDGDNVEYDLWHYFRGASGVESVQFVLRNKPPYDTEAKFKAEREGHLKSWVTNAQGLAPQVSNILAKTKK